MLTACLLLLLAFALVITFVERQLHHALFGRLDGYAASIVATALLLVAVLVLLWVRGTAG